MFYYKANVIDIRNARLKQSALLVLVAHEKIIFSSVLAESCPISVKSNEFGISGRLIKLKFYDVYTDFFETDLAETIDVTINIFVISKGIKLGSGSIEDIQVGNLIIKRKQNLEFFETQDALSQTIKNAHMV
ncbi:MAG: hypothetical protein AAGF85_17770 [Bacteroidota bacterium]